MAFKVYDYKCTGCGRIAMDKFVHTNDIDNQPCGYCKSLMKRMVCAPSLDIEGMSKAGCPGAYETHGDRLTKRHKDSGQDWNAD